MELATTLRLALDSIKHAPPTPLQRALEFTAETHGADLPADPVAHVVEHLRIAGPNDSMLDVLAMAIHAWEHGEVSWAANAPEHSEARRAVILDRLGLTAAQQYVVNARIPRVSASDLPIVIAKDHQPWYAAKASRTPSFYWSHYTGQLLPPRGRWRPADVELLGFSVDDVIARLSDPSRPELYGVKGLVMGYVQSGKTSHFNGVIAKAIDSGYRLVVVLAGTLDILRRQTQRRIDKDLVGRELLGSEEYGSDAEWEAFVSHGGTPSQLGTVDIERLTDSDDDYKSLKRRLSALQFRASDRTKPFNDPANLRLAPARIAVIKKTPSRLKQLCDDLEAIKGLKGKLEHVPTLVIDDESDQASINTVNRRRSGNDERTRTNKEIVRLLRLLPRAQYVGYTATPFANVFIDPDDADDLFPKDFIISLRRPDGYMGVADFYDFDGDFKKGDYRGNQNAYVRAVEGDNDLPANLPKAIDAFVLSGAIKLFREATSPTKFAFRHHTMLIHHAATQVVHDEDKDVVEAIFRRGARYNSTAGLRDLKKLFDEDFAPVSKVRAEGAPCPQSFAELKPYITRCVTKLNADKAVRIVNGDDKHRDDTPDFDATPVWAILVGGTKLSRGYTVEGLTISYYRRPTGAGDTLMQMGRWFGFRPGYQDLVRLFIGREEKRGKTVIDLYEAFGAVCRDEEALRDDLRRYASGGLKPWQVPPLVRQHLAELPPTARSKMFNAEIESVDFAGDWTEKTAASSVATEVRENVRRADELLKGCQLSSRTELSFVNEAGMARKFDARMGLASSDAVLEFLTNYNWAERRQPIALELDYIKRFVAGSSASKWTVLLPMLRSDNAKPHLVPGNGEVSVIKRSRVSGSRFGVYSEPRHVEAAKAIAGVSTVTGSSKGLKGAIRIGSPVLVLYFVSEKGNERAGLSVGFGIQYPGVKRASAIHWRTRRRDRPDEVVVPTRAQKRQVKKPANLTKPGARTSAKKTK